MVVLDAVSNQIGEHTLEQSGVSIDNEVGRGIDFDGDLRGGGEICRLLDRSRQEISDLDLSDDWRLVLVRPDEQHQVFGQTAHRLESLPGERQRLTIFLRRHDRASA